jgi:hypothetical protein
VTLYITPVYYVYLDQLQAKFRKRPGRKKTEAATPDSIDEMALAGRND